MNKRNIILLLICLFITIILILFMLDIYYFKWHENSYLLNNLFNKNSNSYSKTKYLFSQNNLNFVTQDNLEKQKSENIKEQLFFKKNTDVLLKDNKNTPNIKKSDVNNKDQVYAKGSNLPDQNFHSYGEYVSYDEKKYRQELINNLKIKTVIIDKLTKGNGISQEYFRVAYINNMIPAKVLETLVESEEFRNLIPKKYLSNEIKIKGLPKGEFVTIKNSEIKNLLTLWTLGRLTPIQKAWSVNAIK